MQYLYHYYERKIGPFKNLSDIPIDKAKAILNLIKAENKVFAAQRYDGYLERRHELEETARELFIGKGGKPERKTPHYMVVESCPWVNT